MAFVRPTITELVSRIQSDFVSRLELTGAVLRRSMVFVMSRVLAGAVHMLHGNLEFLSKQIFPDTSEAEYLVRHASLFGITRTEATFAEGNVTLTGDDGSVVPVDTVLVRADGVEYTTDAEATIAAGTATVAVTSVLAGADANCDVGVVLSFESPIAGVDSEATVAAGGLAAGTDEETDAALRVRVLERMQFAPHGGAEADYVTWAKEVPGVTRAWVYPLELGAGQVTVRFVRDDDDDIIPSAGEVEDVQDHIDEERPVTATVTVVAPIDTPLDMTIEITPDNSTTRAAVEAEIEDMLRREGEPGGPILLSQLELAVGNATGITDYVITSPAANVTHTTGQIPTLGTITWV